MDLRLVVCALTVICAVYAFQISATYPMSPRPPVINWKFELQNGRICMFLTFAGRIVINNTDYRNKTVDIDQSTTIGGCHMSFKSKRVAQFFIGSGDFDLQMEFHHDVVFKNYTLTRLAISYYNGSDYKTIAAESKNWMTSSIPLGVSYNCSSLDAEDKGVHFYFWDFHIQPYAEYYFPGKWGPAQQCQEPPVNNDRAGKTNSTRAH